MLSTQEKDFGLTSAYGPVPKVQFYCFGNKGEIIQHKTKAYLMDQLPCFNPVSVCISM